jgi:roadblock/LC7 domain-containing protein
MVNLIKLMRLNGAVSAAECKPDGEYMCHITKDVTIVDRDNMSEQFCKINSLMIETMERLDRVNKLNWSPFHGWMVTAGDYSVFVVNQVILIAETNKADFNEILGTLNAEASMALKAA